MYRYVCSIENIQVAQLHSTFSHCFKAAGLIWAEHPDHTRRLRQLTFACTPLSAALPLDAQRLQHTCLMQSHLQCARLEVRSSQNLEVAGLLKISSMCVLAGKPTNPLLPFGVGVFLRMDFYPDSYVCYGWSIYVSVVSTICTWPFAGNEDLAALFTLTTLSKHSCAVCAIECLRICVSYQP